MNPGGPIDGTTEVTVHKGEVFVSAQALQRFLDEDEA